MKVGLRGTPFAILFFACLFIWYAVSVEGREGVLSVSFLNVGQGDSIFIESPNGVQVLIDGGVNKAVLRELGSVMPFYDRSIDLLIATHPDADHIGGFPDVLKRFEVSGYIDSGVVVDTSVYQELESVLTQQQISRRTAVRGMALDLGSGAFLQILFPDRNVSGMQSNDASIVAQLIYGETEFLLTGDAPSKIEEYLVLLDGTRLESDVLKVGHHGSKTSTADSFVGVVSPQYAVISAGMDNRYGHPHQDVLDTLGQFNASVVTTAREGTIVFTSDGETITRVE